jgi:competence protein ComEA
MKKRLLLSVVMFSSSVFATPVNINSADAQTISNSLIGINLKKAEAIVANREQNGAFKSVDDLKRVIAIGEKTIAVNRENILLADSQTLSVTTLF